MTAILTGMLRHGFNYNRWVAADGTARGQQDPAVILASLRSAAANRTSQSGARHLSLGSWSLRARSVVSAPVETNKTVMSAVRTGRAMSASRRELMAAI